MNEQTSSAGDIREIDLKDLKDWGMAYTAQDGGVVGHVAEVVQDDPRKVPEAICFAAAWIFRGGHSIITGNTPNGQPQPMVLANTFTIAPIEFFSTALALSVRPTFYIPLASLNEIDFNDVGTKILANLRAAEQGRIQIRAQRSGLSLAGAGAKLPPAPRGRR
jgi:hypothetical protein